MKKLTMTIVAMMLCVASFAQKQLLPDLVYSSEPAIVKGQVTGMTDANKIESLEITCKPSWSTDEIKQVAKINADGTFEANFDVCVTSRASFSLAPRDEKPFIITPGKEIKITLDLTKSSVKCEGYLAELNNSLANYYNEFREQTVNAEINGQGLSKLQGFTVNQYKDKLLSLYNTAAKKLESDKRLSKEFKEYMLPSYQYLTVALMTGYGKILKYANRGQGDYTQPEGYYNDVKDWNFTSMNGFLYPYAGTAKATAEDMSKATGIQLTVPESTNQVVAAKKYMAELDNLKTFTDEEKTAIKTECPAFENVLLNLNNATQAKIDENNKNQTFKIKDLSADLKGEDVFKNIVKDYKGKMTLVDFWATWCGPCKAAMKTILPVKEELWGKVNFVYVTGETSPRALWNKMVPDIHGDHYYVTADQWDTLLKQFGAQGIPAYVVVDKDGNVVTKHIGYPGNDVIKEELSK